MRILSMMAMLLDATALIGSAGVMVVMVVEPSVNGCTLKNDVSKPRLLAWVDGPVGPVTLLAAPVGPVKLAPVGPVGPVGPVAPVLAAVPAIPCRPVGPVGPVAPVPPLKPLTPGGPRGPGMGTNRTISSLVDDIFYYY